MSTAVKTARPARVRVNLLPDVHQAKVRSKRDKELAVSLAVIICGFTVAVVLIMLAVSAGQKITIRRYQTEINDKQQQLVAQTDLPEMLTVQQHLQSLDTLYGNRAYVSRFFNVLSSSTPTDLAVNSLSIDAQNTLQFSGRARNFVVVDKFAKALAASGGSNPNFTNVQVGSISPESDGKVSFSATAVMSSGVTNGQK